MTWIVDCCMYFFPRKFIYRNNQNKITEPCIFLQSIHKNKKHSYFLLITYKRKMHPTHIKTITIDSKLSNKYNNAYVTEQQQCRKNRTCEGNEYVQNSTCLYTNKTQSPPKRINPWWHEQIKKLCTLFNKNGISKGKSKQHTQTSQRHLYITIIKSSGAWC